VVTLMRAAAGRKVAPLLLGSDLDLMLQGAQMAFSFAVGIRGERRKKKFTIIISLHRVMRG